MILVFMCEHEVSDRVVYGATNYARVWKNGKGPHILVVCDIHYGLHVVIAMEVVIIICYLG